MKIAVITDDTQTISRHFGCAKYYLIYTIKSGETVGSEQIQKPVHQHHHHGHVHLHDQGDHTHGPHDDPQAEAERHADMFEPLRGCDAVLIRGMGRGAHVGLSAIGVQPIITNISTISDAINAYLDGSIVDHPEKLH
ncbi:MAG: NifB/NifX family molybdenum-iron cluster-binding protein [Chloroflexota bacterium]